MIDIFALTQESLLGTDIELVDVERAPKGLLRVVIDHPGGITIDHCEHVSKQLSRVFEVENIDYDRLEVTSPGVDRPLKRLADFVRFSGSRIELRLFEPVDNQKVFRGLLYAPENMQPDEADVDTEFALELEQSSGKVQDLTFTFEDVDRAKLDPILDFKGRKR